MSLYDLLNSHNKTNQEPLQQERARVYVRVSHERSAEKNISPETQRKRIEVYCREQGYEIFQWYDDLGISAFKDDDLRIGWKQMLADAKADPLTTVIVVWRYDRFSRGDNAQVIQRELLRHGVRIESAEEGYYDPDSETGAIMMPLTWSLNRLFSIKLRNVVIPNMKTNFEQRDPETGWAYKNGGWAQWGYKKLRIKVGRSAKSIDIYKVVWVLDDTIVAGKPVWEWARTMLLDWRLGQHLGYDTIAAKLTSAGIPTPSKRTAWSHTTVQGLIGDWTRLYQYAGIAFWNREDCTDRKNRRQRDPSEWIVVPNAHPAIITEQECDDIRKMVDNRSKPKPGRKGEESRFALSGGLLKCKLCGANYAGIKRKSGDYYACGSHLYRRGADCGPAWNIPRDTIENLIFSKILARMPDDPTEFQQWADEMNRQIDNYWSAFTDTAAERKREAKRLEKQLSNLLDLAGSVQSSDELKQRINDTSAALERLRRVNDIEKPSKVDIEKLRQLRDEVAEAAVSTDFAQRRSILKKLVVEIKADPETKTLEGNLIDPRALTSIHIGGGPKGS